MLHDALTHLLFILLLELLDRQRFTLVLDHKIIFLEINLYFWKTKDVLIVFVVLDRHANIILLYGLFKEWFKATSALLFLLLALDFELPGLLKHFLNLLLSLLHSNSLLWLSHRVSDRWVILTVIFRGSLWCRWCCLFYFVFGLWCSNDVTHWLLLNINELFIL